MRSHILTVAFLFALAPVVGAQQVIHYYQPSGSAAASSGTDVQTFTTPGANSWTKPTGAKTVCVILIGARGSGGGGAGGAAAGVAGQGGTGGGGGARVEKCFNAADVASGTVTVGTGANGGNAGGSGGADGSDGTAANIRWCWVQGKAGRGECIRRCWRWRGHGGCERTRWQCNRWTAWRGGVCVSEF